MGVENSERRKEKKRKKLDVKMEIPEKMEVENSGRRKEKKMKKLDVKMEILQEQPEKIAPLVGYFPSGFDPHKADVSKEGEPKVKVFRNELRPNRLQLVVSPEGSKVDFVGTNYMGEGAAAQVCTYALGILDKETNSLKIVPIASNKIFRLEPRVVGSNEFDAEPAKESKEEITWEQTLRKRRELENLYGTKKSIERVNNKLESMQQTDSTAQKELKKKVENVVVNTEALESASSYTTRNIPPHDLTATTPEKAYPLDKIILTGEWDYLLDVLELIQSGGEVTTDVYPSFVCNRVHKLEAIQDEEEKQKLACIFSYITYLLNFKDYRSATNKKKEDYPSANYSLTKSQQFPKILYHKFTENFTDSELRVISAEKTNLLISYILVLTLIVDEFKTNISDIASDLRMEPLKLREHYNNLGCKLSSVVGATMATLPVPLKFPKLVKRRLRR